MQAGGSLISGWAEQGIAGAEARMIETASAQKAGQVRREARATAGAARAAAAASGVSVGSGSVMDVEQSIARYSEQDALSILTSGAAQASARRSAGRQAMVAGVTGAAGSLIHGASNVYQAQQLSKLYARTGIRPGE
jgi:hypothetical protein